MGELLCADPFFVEKAAYSATDHTPKGQAPLILNIPTTAKYGAEIELWFYPGESAMVPRNGWASMVVVETGLGAVVAFAKTRPGLVHGISERPRQ